MYISCRSSHTTNYKPKYKHTSYIIIAAFMKYTYTLIDNDKTFLSVIHSSSLIAETFLSDKWYYKTIQAWKINEIQKKLESVHRAQTPSQYISQAQKLKWNTKFY